MLYILTDPTSSPHGKRFPATLANVAREEEVHVVMRARIVYSCLKTTTNKLVLNVEKEVVVSTRYPENYA